MSPTFSSLEIRNYRLWFLGGFVSNVGTWIGRVGQDWLPPPRLTPRRAYGFHSAQALIGLALLTLGGLCPPLPGRSLT